MILYHSVTMYQVLEAIVHRERVHQGEYSVLLLADFSTDKYHDYRELEAFFDEVRLFPYRSISNDPDTILGEVESAYQKTVPYGIGQFEHIYVAASYYYFSLYLIANRIPFHMFEDGGGILSKPKVLYEIIRDVTPIMAEIAQTYGLLDGRNEYILDAVCNFSTQSFLVDDPKWKDFNPVQEITRLSPETIRRILHFYRLEPIRDIPDNAALIFTQQFANLYTTSREDQIAIYQVCCDFFLPDQALIIKPHPYDNVDYGPIFPEARLIRGVFPAELMPVLLDRVPETSFTVYSASVLNIRSIFRKNIICGYDFPKTFHAIDLYYFALRLISEMDILKGCPVHTFGVDVCMLECIAEHSLKTRFDLIHETALRKGETALKEDQAARKEEETGCRQVWIIDDCTFQSDYFQTKKKDTSFAWQRVEVKGVEPPEPAPAIRSGENISAAADPGSADGSAAGSADDSTAGSATGSAGRTDRPAVISAAGSAGQPERPADTLSASDFLEAAGKGDLVLFLKPQSDSRFFEKGTDAFRPGMIPVHVRKKRLREDHVFFPDHDDTICAYTLDDALRERVTQFHARIILKHAGLAEEI